jgi:hypothetical protein
MDFNVKKRMVMHLGHRNKQQPYYMEGEQLHVTERDIGVTMANC